MIFKVSSFFTSKDLEDLLIIGTHNSKFHSDELFACAVLCLLNSHRPIQILRTRDSKLLMKCDICIDIGGGKFDHHQPGFNQKRKSGIKYASAGLVWKDYGRQLINLLCEKFFHNTKCNTDLIFQLFDESLVSLVDSEDNGIATHSHCFNFIPFFLPLWFNNSQDNFNKQFYKVLLMTMDLLEYQLKQLIYKDVSPNIIVHDWKQFYRAIIISQQKLKTNVAKKVAKTIIISHWKNNRFFYNGILEIPSQTMLWEETVININSNTEMNSRINFVVFPYPNGGWAAQCVPPSLKDIFAQRIPFPSDWAGQTVNLPMISGVKGATRCNGRFFVTADNRDSIIQMCNIATNSLK